MEKSTKEYGVLMNQVDHLVKKGGKGNFKRYLKEKTKLVYFECGRSGHMKSECFKLKNEQWDRHKGYRAQWDGVETNSDSSK